MRLPTVQALAPHPDTPSGAVRRVSAGVAKAPDGKLRVTYVLDADLERLRIPAARPPRPAEGLWRHTCCEIFIRRKGSSDYREFNFAPSGEWAAYAFERYRERGPDLADAGFDPEIAVYRSDKRLQLDAVIPLDRLWPPRAGTGLSIALAAVIEDRDGALSYWALRHPPGKPDFHHADAFALDIE